MELTTFPTPHGVYVYLGVSPLPPPTSPPKRRASVVLLSDIQLYNEVVGAEKKIKIKKKTK